MHKRIALLIKKMCDESPYDHFTCKVLKKKKSDGFWRVLITFKSRQDAHSESLVRLLEPLGMVYGEGLYIEDKGNTVEVS